MPKSCIYLRVSRASRMSAEMTSPYCKDTHVGFSLGSRLHEPGSMLLLMPLERELCQGRRAPAASRDAASLPSVPRRIQKYFQVCCQRRFPGTSAANLPWVGVSMEGDFMVCHSQCAEGGGRNNMSYFFLFISMNELKQAHLLLASQQLERLRQG